MEQDPAKKKGTEILSNLAQGAVAIGKKAAVGAKTGVTAIVEKAKADEVARKLKKLNPLFPEQYNAATFTRPNIIVIVDDAVRKGIELCEGSIGWISNENGSEVLYLYDEAVVFSGVQFVPAVNCDAVYCMDQFDRNRYLRTDCIFNKALEEKIAELEHIAFCIGAKRCIIDIRESSSSDQTQEQNVGATGSKGENKIAASFGMKAIKRSGSDQRGYSEVVFEGDREPRYPTLKWFAYDDGINALIDMCCNGQRHIKTKTLELAGSSSATMSMKVASTLDGLLSGGSKAKAQSNMTSMATQEQQRVLRFELEF